MNILQKIGEKIPLIGRVFIQNNFKKISFEYDVMITFLEAHEHVIHLLSEFLQNENVKTLIINEVKDNISAAEIMI